MKYTKEQRLHIGQLIYNNELTKFEAAEKYEISVACARDYMRMYRDANNLPVKDPTPTPGRGKETSLKASNGTVRITGYEQYESMTREELIRELIMSKINEARAKKGYTVKGDGTEKVFEPIGNKNTKS